MTNVECRTSNDCPLSLSLSLSLCLSNELTLLKLQGKSPCLAVFLLFCFSVFNRCREVFTEPFPSSGLFVGYSWLREHVLGESFAINGLPSLAQLFRVLGVISHYSCRETSNPMYENMNKTSLDLRHICLSSFRSVFKFRLSLILSWNSRSGGLCSLS
jgi:hypothetical protein